MNVTPELFVAFAREKLAADGSDAYINGAVALATASDDPLWYAGVFTTPYAPPTSEVIFEHWPRARVLADPNGLRDWVTANWKALPISGARHVNGMGTDKLARTLYEYARWVDGDGPARLAAIGDPEQAFTALRRNVVNHGRYTGMKLYETLRRLGVPVPPFVDIQPRGGRTPRRALRSIFPETEHDHRTDRAPARAQANALAGELRAAIPTTWFNVEVLLCNFHQALDGRFYVGYALDKELARARQVQTRFPTGADRTLANRPRLYPGMFLGELNGWGGVRDDLRPLLRDDATLWSDRTHAYPSKQRRRAGWLLGPVVGIGEERA